MTPKVLLRVLLGPVGNALPTAKRWPASASRVSRSAECNGLPDRRRVFRKHLEGLNISNMKAFEQNLRGGKISSTATHYMKAFEQNCRGLQFSNINDARKVRPLTGVS
jgi:hypothetical protein